MKHRQLNIELLRIFAMILILLWHISGKMLPLIPHDFLRIREPLNYINLFITFHVDLFVLITGYFGIRNRWRHLANNVLLCTFYVTIMSACRLVAGDRISWREFLPFSMGPWWFMKCYLILVLISPVIECYLNSHSKLELNILIGIAAFISVYLGWGMHVQLYDNHGYDIFNFILLYIIGHKLKQIDMEGAKIKSTYLIGILLFCCIVRYKVQNFSYFNWFDYTSPLNILMAICVFCLFLKMDISQKYSRFILFFSSSVISVYLITDYPKVIPLVSRVLDAGNTEVPFAQFAYLTLFVILIFVGCCSIDKVRMLICKPILRSIANLFNRFQLQDHK